MPTDQTLPDLKIHPLTSERWAGPGGALRRAGSLRRVLVYVVEIEALQIREAKRRGEQEGFAGNSGGRRNTGPAGLCEWRAHRLVFPGTQRSFPGPGAIQDT